MKPKYQIIGAPESFKTMYSADNSAQILMSAKDLQRAGFSRAIVYELLNRADMPVVSFGRRKFMLREKFLARLDEMAEQAAG